MKKFYLSTIALMLFCFQLNAQQVIFNGNYAAGIAFAAFGGSTNNLSIDGAQLYGGQPSLLIPVPASGYTGGALVDSTPVNLTAYNAVSFWVKSSIPTTLDVSGFGNNAVTAAYATEFDGDSIQTTWTKIIIPIPDPSKLTSLAGLFHFAQGSQHGAFTIWMNDIQYENITGGVIGTAVASMATQTVTETAAAVFTVSGITVSIPVNGKAESLTSVAPVYFTYASSTAGIVSFDALGNITAVASGSTNVTAKLGSVNVAGTLTVNVSGLTGPTTPAPTPTIPAADVISLFNSSHVYTVNNPVDAEGWIAPWCNAKLTDPYVIPSTTDSIKEFYNLVYSGTEFTTHEIDATSHKYFHIDVWTPNVQSLAVKLVDFAPSGAYNGATNLADQKTFTLTAGVWNTLVIDLDSLPGLNNSYNYMAQLLLVDNDNGGAGGGSIYFDNIYFSSVGSYSPPTAPLTPAPTPTIPAADVISLFNSSHVYTVNNPVDAEGWLAPWAGAKLTDPYIIAATTDSIKEFYNLAYSGTEFTSNEINATADKYFHIDVWSANIQSLSVKLVDFAPSGAYNAATNLADLKTFTLTPGVWNSLVVDLDSLPGLNNSYNYMAQLLLVDNDNPGAGSGSVYFDNVYFSSVGSIVPITFIGFNGQLVNNAALLNWSTSNEIQNKGFEVQKSIDGKNFTDIAFIAGKGNTTPVNKYSFSDPTVISGDNYYRLKQIDMNGNVHYSSIIKLESSNFGWNIMGNPSSKTSIQLQLDKGVSNISLKVISVSGKVVQAINKSNLSLGTYNIPIDLSKEASGIYIVKLQVGNNEYAKKVIKL